MLSVVFPTTVLERREKASWTTAEGTAAIEAAEKKGICVALARSKDPFVLDTVEIGFISLVGNLNVAKGGLFIEEYGFPPFDRLLKGIPDLSMHCKLQDCACHYPSDLDCRLPMGRLATTRSQR